tara:strand:- start:159 stop:386 length:228 start_codon:yes stop_codon:yes gene_type:complete
MKVKDLKEILSHMDDDLEIVMARDPEGNGYAPLYSYWVGNYLAEEGAVFDPSNEEELEYYQENMGVKALIIGPEY